MKKKPKKTTNHELHIVPQRTLHIKLHRKGDYKQMQRFVHTNGVISGEDFARLAGVDHEDIIKVFTTVEHVIRCGCEARPLDENDGIRFYPVVKPDFKTPFICSQTIGRFRDSINDMETIVTHNNAVVSDTAKDHGSRADFYRKAEDKRIAEGKRYRVCVTPDTMVTCPKCGSEFRVGKVLGNK